MIHGGVLTALATPADFKAHYLHGRLFAVRSADTLGTLAILQQRSDISDVTLYNDSIHVLMQQGDASDLASALAAAGIVGATVESIAPTLEDIFISLMKR